MNRVRGQPTEMRSVEAHGEYGSLLGQILASEPCEGELLSARREPRLPIPEPADWNRDPPHVRSIRVHDVDALLVDWVTTVGLHGDQRPVRRPGRLSAQSLRVGQHRHVGSVGPHGKHVVDDVRIVRVRIGPVAVEHERFSVRRPDGPAAVGPRRGELLGILRGARFATQTCQWPGAVLAHVHDRPLVPGDVAPPRGATEVQAARTRPARLAATSVRSRSSSSPWRASVVPRRARAASPRTGAPRGDLLATTVARDPSGADRAHGRCRAH